MASTCLFIDNSGSTSNCRNYHARVLDCLDKYPSDSRVFVWNSVCKETTNAAVRNNSSTRFRGEGGTSVRAIADFILKEGVQMTNMVIVTDGQICAREASDVARTFTVTWQRTDAYLVTPNPDTSVIAPFINGVPFELFDENSEMVSRTSITEEKCMELINSLETPEEFELRYNDIYASIASMTVAREASYQLREGLIDLKKRVMAAAAKAAAASTAMAAGSDTTPTVDYVTTLAQAFYSSSTTDTASRLDALLSLCNTAGDFSVSRMRVQRDVRASVPTNPEAPDSMPDVDDCDCEWEDEILMVPSKCMLLTFDQDASGILEDQPQERLEAIQRNPLNLLKYPDLVERLQGAMLHPLSREVMVDLLQLDGEQVPRHPYSRKTLMHEFICFGTEPIHVKANKACLAKLMYGGRRLFGNYPLWMVVMWRVSTRVQYIDSAPTSEFMREFLLSATLPMGMNGVGQRPTQRVNLATALLYAVHSTRLFDDGRDVMRELHGAFPAMQAALALVGVDVSEYEPRVQDVAAAAGLLRSIKKMGHASVLKTIRSKVAETLTIGDQVFLLDKAREQIEDRHLRALALCKVLNANLSFGDVKIPADLDTAAALSELRLGHNYSPEENAMLGEVPDICECTLRPWTSVNGIPWEEVAAQEGGPLSEQISGHRWVLVFVERTQRIPDPDSMDDMREMLSFLEHAYGPCLPVSVQQLMRVIMQQVKDKVGQRTLTEVLDIIRRGYTRAEREKMEAG